MSKIKHCIVILDRESKRLNIQLKERGVNRRELEIPARGLRLEWTDDGHGHIREKVYRGNGPGSWSLIQSASVDVEAVVDDLEKIAVEL